MRAGGYSGPDLSEKTKPVRQYLQKGADFTVYADDHEAHDAREWIIQWTLEKCILLIPDWDAAAYPLESGRPFEAFLEASDESWCVCLCQRDKPGGIPRVIAFVRKGFVEEATRWSAFEREYYCFKEGYAAIAKWVIGFRLFI